jgi:hypothetical protein
MSRRWSLITAVAAVWLAGSPVAGQVAKLRDLAFGTITSGTTTSVSKTSASAAEWSFTGSTILGANFQLTLPTVLNGPGATLAITFSTTDGIYRKGTNDPTGGTVFNPHNPVSIGLLQSGTWYVWLGASVSPPLNQKPGTYTGTVVLTTTGIN